MMALHFDHKALFQKAVSVEGSQMEHESREIDAELFFLGWFIADKWVE